MNYREQMARRKVKLYNLEEEQRKDFYKGAFRDHFRKYESQYYWKPVRELVENKFVTYHMQDNYAKKYHDMVTEQRDRDWKKLEERL